MNILLIQARGEHPENEQFKEALCLQRALMLLGHDARVCGKGYHAGYPDTETIDAIVLLENYDTGWIPDFSKAKCLKLFWSVDGFCCYDMHKKMIEQYKIDVVLSSTISTKFDRETIWFPNAFPNHLFYNSGIPQNEKYDVGYCGSYGNPDRRLYIEQLAAEKNMHCDIMVLGDSMVRAINSYKIHFNRNVGIDVNGRTFETLGCGTFLLTNKTEGLDSIFTIGEHLVCYEDYNDCRDKIDYFLQFPEYRERIARRGQAHAREHHTFLNRAEYLVRIIEQRSKGHGN